MPIDTRHELLEAQQKARALVLIDIVGKLGRLSRAAPIPRWPELIYCSPREHFTSSLRSYATISLADRASHIHRTAHRGLDLAVSIGALRDSDGRSVSLGESLVNQILATLCASHVHAHATRRASIGRHSGYLHSVGFGCSQPSGDRPRRFGSQNISFLD